MNEQINLPKLSRRSLELLFLITDNVALPISSRVEPTILLYTDFARIHESFSVRTNLTVAISNIRWVLDMYGYFILAVHSVGYTVHKSIYHVPTKFARKFHGAQKIDKIFDKG